ncbi:MAG: hypothetical protein FJX35_09860 [Alphaproteobacteria bacterium]|nr:hypothetical protein [Alphaproteobacteria bacterium]
MPKHSPKGGKSQQNDKAEAERRQIETLKANVTRAVDNVQRLALAGNVSNTERGIKTAQEAMKNPKLPRDFTQIETARLKKLELESYTKATDIAIRKAMNAAKADDVELKYKLVSEAKGLMQKAVSLKAPADFKTSALRMIEAVMLSGSIVKEGPTKAKPLDTAPKPPDRAHMPDTVETPDRAHMPDRVPTPDRAHDQSDVPQA